MKKDVTINKLIKTELEDANSKFPLFSSSHEAYSVLLEEVEESVEALDAIAIEMQVLWGSIRANQYQAQQYCISKIYEKTLNLIEEALQVAAMCEKYKMSLFKPSDKETT